MLSEVRYVLQEYHIVIKRDVIEEHEMLMHLAHVPHVRNHGKVEELRPAFRLAERLISIGTEADRHAAIVGFLETVQNVASHRPCGAAYRWRSGRRARSADPMECGPARATPPLKENAR